MYSINIYALVCLLLTAPAIFEAVHIVIEPNHQHVRPNNSATVLCRISESNGDSKPITACEIMRREWLKPNSTTTLLDLSLGYSSNLTDAYGYHGSGLVNGECGVTVQPPYVGGLSTLVCRVKVVGESRWLYSDEATLDFDYNYTAIPYELTPHHVITLPGRLLDFTAVTDDGDELGGCYFNLPSNPNEIDFSKGAGSDQSWIAHMYFGRGLDQGDCGISFNVSENQSGLVISRICRDREGILHDGLRISRLTVATAPESILLTMNNQPLQDGAILNNNGSAILNATCVVKNSRPVANIMWLLGDVVVRQDEQNEEPETGEWLAKYDLQTIRQDLIRTVSETDSGKQLLCRVSHMALPSGTVDSNVVTLVF